MRKVRMSETIAGEDLLDQELVNLTRDGLIKKFFETYPNAERVTISVSHGINSDDAEFVVEGVIFDNPHCQTCNGWVWIEKLQRYVIHRETVGMVCQTCGHDYSKGEE